MRHVDLVVSSSWVLPVIPKEDGVLEDHAIVVHDGKIVDILSSKKADVKYTADNRLYLDKHVLLPGFVNAHTHSPMNLFRGLADDLSLMDWLQKHIWPAESKIMNEKAVKAGSRLAIAEMIRGGITCFNDNYFFPEATAQVVVAEGIRAQLGCVIINVPTRFAETENEYLNKAENTFSNFDACTDRISYAIAPHALYTISEDSMVRIRNLSKMYDIPIHMHVHETEGEVLQSLKENGKRPIEILQDFGLLSDRFIGVHMVHLSDSDISTLKELNVNVVNCPESNLKLASGLPNIAKLISSGINVAIGTDGAASNNDLDLLCEIRTAVLIAKAISKDPTVLPAKKAIEMLTINGARALGLEHKIGSLEVGKDADFISIDLGGYLTQPVYNVNSSIIYSASRSHVKDVWVKGVQLLKGGEFTKLDIDSAIDAVLPFIKQASFYANM